MSPEVSTRLRGAILAEAHRRAPLPQELYDWLVERGWSGFDVSGALSKMWDEGDIEIGADRRIRLPEDGR